jgi:hypothetical protein
MKNRVKTLALLPLLTVVLLLLGMAAPLGASAARSNPPSSRATQFSSLPVFVNHKKTTSTNWAGFATSGGPFTTVSAQWIEPAVTCSQSSTYSVFWVGLDGFNSSTVEQTGTAAFCQGGNPDYFAWYEVYPKEPIIEIPNKPVLPGDAISASATAVSSTSFKLDISDSTQNWTFTTTQTQSGAQLSSAEVIAEAPSSGSVLPLADFGTVHFTSSMVDGQSIGSLSPTKIVMVTSSGTVKAKPSALSHGTAFKVTWKHS